MEKLTNYMVDDNEAISPTAGSENPKQRAKEATNFMVVVIDNTKKFYAT